MLSTVGHAPTTILADFARCGTHAVQPWRPSHGYFGKVEIGSKILEATSRNFSGPTSFQMFGKHLEERLRTGSKYLELWNVFGKVWLV